MKKNKNLTLWALSFCSAVLLSLPWLVPHLGIFALVGFVPLLCADYIASGAGVKRFWIWHYCTFVLWNAFTTFWVCNATVGGGIFAVLANALQMSLIFGLFRLAKKRLGGVVPYIFLAVTWIAWERWYLTSAQISWPWLVLGNAFATTIKDIQWYSVTGTLGGSLWVWCSNLALFGAVVCIWSGSWKKWNRVARISSAVALPLVLLGPPICSAIMFNSYSERSEGSVEVVIGQPNLDPYKKFSSMTQAQQTDVLLGLYEQELSKGGTDLLLAPETFTFDVILNDIPSSPTWQRFHSFLQEHPGTDILFGASTNELFHTRAAPGLLSYPWGDGWRVPHNSALMLSEDGRTEVFHKSKLVVGTELTPYPKVFVPLDNWLSKTFGDGQPLMARDSGQDEISLLHLSDGTPLGCAVCYESVYGEYCTGYTNRGAGFLTVITNDSWWGNTPGYRQHLSYSCLRAIELRRDIARCGNSGISCFINQKGEILQRGPWWEEAVLRGSVNINTRESFFARHGDVTGRVCTLAFLLLGALLIVRLLSGKKK
ncbi:MAG: apolipoprotein N-acyltransferase [Bacteroidales bacterium]|nr:apolipoprotein N-acyltransferase [Bacteroidales bacterium]